MTANELINSALSKAYPFIRETDYAPGQMLKLVAGLDQEVTYLYSVHAPERISVTATPVPVVVATNPTGYTLTTAYSYSNLKWVDNNGFVWPINIVSENHFDHPGQHPAGIIRGMVFFPADPAEVRWTNLGAGGAQGQRQFFQGNGDTITYNYIAMATDMESLSQNVTSPDEARQYFTSSLTMHLLLNSADMVPKERLQMQAQMMKSRKDELLMNMMKRTDTRSRAFEQP